MHTHVYTHICLYMYTDICVYIHIHTYKYSFIHMYTYILYTFLYLSIYLAIYIYTHTYTYTSSHTPHKISKGLDLFGLNAGDLEERLLPFVRSQRATSQKRVWSLKRNK